MIPFEHTRSIACETGTVYLCANGVVIIDQVPRATQTWESASEMMAAGIDLVPEGQRAAMVVFSNESRTDRGGRRAFQEVGGELLSCVALIVKSKVSEVTGNFFLRIQKPSYPMQLFGNADDAMNWAKSHVGKPLGPGAPALLESLKK